MKLYSTFGDNTDGSITQKSVTDNLNKLEYSEIAGGKNLLNPTLTTTVLNGVTCTKNTDGTYTLNGTATADTTFRLVDDNILKSILTNNKSVRLVGSPRSDVYLQIWIKEQGTSRDRGNGVNINTNGITITNCNIVIVIPNGVVCNNYIFKPMITTNLTDTYNSFTQWVPSVKILAEEVNQTSSNLLDLKMLGWTVPKDCPIQNEVNANQFIQKCGRIDLGSLKWGVNSLNSKPYSFVTYSNGIPDLVTVSNTDDKVRCYSSDFATDSAVNTIAKNTLYKFAIISDKRLYTYSSKETAAEVMDELKGKYLYYELATPITKVIDGNEVGVIAGNAGAHNCVYRGKYLGSSVTAEQYSAISSGTFDGLYIGDYWTIDGINYRIAAFDYYWNSGITALTTHHAVIVPDSCLYSYAMNDSNTTNGGYVGSKMYTDGLTQAKSIINLAFNGHVFKPRLYLVNATANGKASAGDWYYSEVDLMNEQMVYGSNIFSSVSDGTKIPTNQRVEKTQLPLFAFNPGLINNRTSWWLRDIITSTYFARISAYGVSNYDNASTSLGVRPSFCIS